MENYRIKTKSIKANEFANLIEFDDRYLSAVMLEIGAPSEQLPPSLTIDELKEAHSRNDVLQWIFLTRI